jgi:hypothetical protein
MPLIWVRREGKYFCGQDWTGQISLIPQANFPDVRNVFASQRILSSTRHSGAR